MDNDMNIKLTLGAAVLCAALIFSGCGKDKNVVYRTDVAAQEIVDACVPNLSSYHLLAAADEDYIRFRLKPDSASVAECVVYLQNAGISIDEVGILKCATEDTSSAEETVKAYLATRNEEWTGQYLIEEYPKLRDAEYKVIGQYVVYGILSEEDKAVLFDSVQKYLITQ